MNGEVVNMARTRGAPPARRRTWVAALIIGIALLGVALIRGSMQVVQAECELCVEFRGQTTCRSGSGASEVDARQAAQRAACAVMAMGMDESIACQNQPPKSVQCGRA
jgi:hypothetical protein